MNIKITLKTRKKKNLIKGVKKFIDESREDLNAVLERDPAAKSKLEVITLYSGYHALIMHRIAHSLNNNKYEYCARLLSQFAKLTTGIEIHPGAEIGKGTFIDHGSGVVIGETTIIGDNCTIYQGVTLGGTGKETGKRHPTLGDNVMVGSGAKLLGAINIGSNSKIAAGAVVLKDVPEHSTAVGIPAKIVRIKGKKVDDSLDQIHIPDPVAEEINNLKQEITAIKNTLNTEK